MFDRHDASACEDGRDERSLTRVGRAEVDVAEISAEATKRTDVRGDRAQVELAAERRQHDRRRAWSTAGDVLDDLGVRADDGDVEPRVELRDERRQALLGTAPLGRVGVGDEPDGPSGPRQDTLPAIRSSRSASGAVAGPGV